VALEWVREQHRMVKDGSILAPVRVKHRVPPADCAAGARIVGDPRRMRRTRPRAVAASCPGAPLSSDTLPEGLRLLNRAPSVPAEEALRACCGSHRWARRVAAHRPYPTVEALLAAADEAAYDLTSGDLAEALAGEATTALPDRGGLRTRTALRAAYAAYEAKFGHAFVIALDTRDPAEALDQTLAGLRVRLCHDEDEESVVTAEHLRRICRTRLLHLAAGSTTGRADGAHLPGPSPDRAGSITPAPPRGTTPTSRRYDGRGRWTVPGRA
jgi:2-oxo-4-hydroxy-4-carboxy-5-ureidoimidazoline decarboxylase